MAIKNGGSPAGPGFAKVFSVYDFYYMYLIVVVRPRFSVHSGGWLFFPLSASLRRLVFTRELFFFPLVDTKIRDDVKWLQELDAIFKNNYEIDPFLGWQFFATPKGVLNRYPGTEYFILKVKLEFLNSLYNGLTVLVQPLNGRRCPVQMWAIFASRRGSSRPYPVPRISLSCSTRLRRCPNPRDDWRT